jgi:photoactive yellow protein
VESTPPSLEILPELFDHLPVGVVVLDHRGRVAVFNRAEEELARRPRTKVLGREFFREVAPCMDVRDLGGRFASDIGKKLIDVNVEFAFAHPHADGPRDVRVRMRTFESAGLPYAMLVLEDLSRERAVERMKTRLSELLVHDLKNPLSVVLSSLEFLDTHAQRKSEDVDIHEAIADSVDSVRRAQSMLIDLLDVTRLETNVMPLRRERLDAREVVHHAARSARAAGRHRQIVVEERVPDGPLWIEADAGLLRRCLENLTDNALRYARRLVFSAEQVGGRVVFEVIDDGPGIPEDVRARIFERYVQVSSPSTATMNRGLGLTFVKLAAEAHGGDASVECPAAGGTIFRIALPLVTPAPVAAIAR